MIQEIISHSVGENGFGTIRHRFVSPTTHWCDEIATVTVHMYDHKVTSINFNYGSGGTRSDVPDTEIAYAMASAFTLVSARLKQLYEQYDYQPK